jgi:dolichol-phosphate mannosyltransferase
MNKISIIVPIFNEDKNLEKLFNDIFNVVNEKFEYEIVAINDGSTDQSLSMINKFKQKLNISIINKEKNEGQSAAFYDGIKIAKYKNIITIDSDNQNDPKDILKLSNLYFMEKYSLVGGIRKKRNDNKIKIISSIIANKIRNLVLKDGCPDTGCSLKIFSRDIFLSFDYFDGMHRFIPALFKALNQKSTFVEVNHFFRKYGNSKYGTLDRLFNGITNLNKVKKIIKENHDRIS